MEKKKLGKNRLYHDGTLVAYGCTTCNCYCSTTCTNCNSKSPTELGSYALDLANTTTTQNKGLPFTI